jgi:hypothetical protein
MAIIKKMSLRSKKDVRILADGGLHENTIKAMYYILVRKYVYSWFERLFKESSSISLMIAVWLFIKRLQVNTWK